MDDLTAKPIAAPVTAKRKKPGPIKQTWIRIRGPLARSRVAKGALTMVFTQGLRFVGLTNRLAEGSSRLFGEHAEHEPGIIALWHGQHLATPAFYPSKRKLVAMVSRSADAEMNAKLLQSFGIDVVRGSGGREGVQRDKGGARALVALKKALEAGNNVCMIADIPHGTPREAGMGVILLAKISGRPIAPSAFTTSRRLVLEKSWDKTTISLPFGRSAVAIEDLIYVPADADEEMMEAKRQELTAALNNATRKAEALADGAA